MRLTLPKTAFAALLVASAGAFAQQGTAGAPARARRPRRRRPRRAPQIQVIPNDGSPPIVVPPGGKATITTTVLPEPQPTDSNAQRARSQPLNNAPFWRGVHDSGNVPGTRQQPADRRARRADPADHGLPRDAGDDGRRGVAAAAQLVDHPVRRPHRSCSWSLAVALYYWWKGPIGGHGRHTGRVIERFTYFERVVHWSTAITFTILAVSGAVMSFGKFLLLPIIGGSLFGWLT